MKHKIKIKYDGKWPNLCSGNLIIVIDGRVWPFPDYCLSSGGEVFRDNNDDFKVTEGKWSISDWPDSFPDELKEPVVEAINEEISWGCCGGCV